MYLAQHDEALARRRETLHKDWSRTVFDELQQQVQRGLDARSTAAIERRRRDALQHYLDASNRKAHVGGVVLDDEERLGVDAPAARAHAAAIKVDVSRLQDPTQRGLDAIRREERLLRSFNSAATGGGELSDAAAAGAAVGGIDALAPRSMLPVTAWAQVRQTQGRYAEQADAAELARQDPRWGAGAGPRPLRLRATGQAHPATFASSVAMDHFTPAAELAVSDPQVQRATRARELALARRAARKAALGPGAAGAEDEGDTAAVVDHSAAYANNEGRGRGGRVGAGTGGVSSITTL